MNFLLEKTDLIVPYPIAITVRLFNGETRALEPIACRNLNEEEWKAEEWKGGRDLPSLVLQSKAPLTIRNVQKDERTKDHEFFRKHGLVSYLGVPLSAKGEILGVLGFYSKGEHEFAREEIELLSTIAGQAAIAIYNAQLYEQIRRQALDLERSNKIKDEFLGVMSHELRTPISVVMGYTGMLREKVLGDINPRQDKVLETIMSRTSDQLALVNNILYAALLETHQLKSDSRVVNLKDLLGQLRDTYSKPLKKEPALHWDYPAETLAINIDASKVKHILQNLIDNAMKFTSKGQVTISATIGQEATDRRRPWVEFKVADTGVGIPEEHLPFIFDKFRQADSSETRPYGGTGMGLYIVKQFTELLGGTLEVESQPGKGSTFTVRIPVGG